MKFMKKFMVMLLFICLISIASASASELDDTVISSDNEAKIIEEVDNSIITSSQEETVENEDNNPELTSQEDEKLELVDNGTFTSLQEKINYAEEGSTISLDKDYTYDEGFNTTGILIDKNLTINGNGHTLNGLSKSRILFIMFGIKDNNKVVLNNIKFINGKTGLYGGAIFNFGDLTVNKCTFKNNYAKYCGGAINSVGSLNLKNSVFIKNTAGGDGGAVLSLRINKAVDHYKKFYEDITPKGDMEFIFDVNFNVSLSFGTDHIKNCTFNNNTAKGRGGGAVYAFSHINISSSKFSSNKAKEHGGAVFANKNLYITKSKFSNNKVAKNGGAVYFKCHEPSGSYVNGKWVSKMKYYSAKITSSSFAKNTAAKGGAIYGFVYSSSDKKRLKVNKCNFTNNKATKSGRDVLGGTCSKCIFNYLKLSLKTVTIKKSAKSLTLTATLKKGIKAIKNKKITFKFNGKTYTARTNSKGIAKVKIKRTILKKLKVGKKIAYQAKYGKLNIKKTAKVKK